MRRFRRAKYIVTATNTNSGVRVSSLPFKTKAQAIKFKNNSEANWRYGYKNCRIKKL